MLALLPLWLAGRALAADPLLDGLPGADAVVIRRGPERWTVTVRGRSATLPPVVTEADRAALRALVTSLLSDLDLSSPDDAAIGASVALALLGTPPARPLEPAQARVASVRDPEPKKLAAVLPPPEPVVAPEPPLPELAPGIVRFVPFTQAPSALARPPEPALPLSSREQPARRALGWGGGELLVRPSTSPAPGAVLGLDLGERLGARLGLRPVRSVALGRPKPRTGLGELAIDLVCCARSAPLHVQWGGGLAVRRYATDGRTVALHAMPRAAARLGWALRAGSLGLEPEAGLELDLLPTRFGWSSPDQTLFPVALGFGLKIGRAFEPQTPAATPGGEPLQRGDP